MKANISELDVETIHTALENTKMFLRTRDNVPAELLEQIQDAFVITIASRLRRVRTVMAAAV
jgi:hypothetical protein